MWFDFFRSFVDSNLPVCRSDRLTLKYQFLCTLRVCICMYFYLFVRECVCHHWFISTQLFVASVNSAAAVAHTFARTHNQLHITFRHILLRFSEQIIIIIKKLRISLVYLLFECIFLDVSYFVRMKKKNIPTSENRLQKLHKS